MAAEDGLQVAGRLTERVQGRVEHVVGVACVAVDGVGEDVGQRQARAARLAAARARCRPRHGDLIEVLARVELIVAVGGG